MYIYFCSALGAMGLALRARARVWWPRTSETALLVGMWAFFFAFDFAVENAIIRLTDAYSFVRTQGSLTLWAGSQYQFPVYESICVAFVAMAFAAVRISADADPRGISFIERGLGDLPSWSRLAARALAAIGYSAVVLIMLYHLPFNWLGVGGSSLAHLPSYLMPG
jgi:vacuolar-type H+-ATPase subunit I/STV1